MNPGSAGTAVFRNGPIFCSDPDNTTTRAVAISQGMIVAVGDEEVAPYLRGADEVVDLQDRLLLPGFIDAHAHPVAGGLERLRCNLLTGSSFTDYAKSIGEYAAANPRTEWILGGGWSMDAFPGGRPTRQQLDGIVADRPICLPNRDHHSTWVNTVALEMAGIDASTPDPGDGRIERDAAGRPTGLLHEGAADIVHRIVPDDTQEDLDAGLREAQQYLHACGVVGWQDAMVRVPGPGASIHKTYLRAHQEGWLTANVVGALWWERTWGQDEIEEKVSQLVAVRDATAAIGGQYRTDSVKIMVDGVVETFTAALLEPYLDSCGHPTAKSGLDFFEPELLRAVVRALDKAGFQVHFHALGDRAVRGALDAVEAARVVNGSADRRHQLAHLQLVDSSDVQRFERLGVGANLQGLWATHEPQMDELTIPYLGSERARSLYPFGDLYRAGATLVMGSDWPVSDPEPMAAVHTAVNRVCPEAALGTPPLGESQKLPLVAALRAYTAGSAWSNRDPRGGAIRVGNRADLVLLDRDPFALEPTEIGSCQVDRTYAQGRLVYER